MTGSSAHPSPELFYQTVDGHQRTAVLKAAIDLDLFTALGSGGGGRPATAGELAAKCSTSPRGMRILCDFLTVIGFLTKSGDGRYALTGDSAAFLDRQSPAYLGGTVDFLLSPQLLEDDRTVAAAVRHGGRPHDAGTMEPENPVWVNFARSMAPMMRLPAQLFAGLIARSLTGSPPPASSTVLDIAAGHGLFGITLAQQLPGAQVVAQDWASVLEVAKANARAVGLENRYRTLPGSAFDVDFGGGYDVVLLTNFLHHFDAATNEQLLRKVYAALKPGGLAAVLEFVPNDDRISPPQAAMFSMVMLHTTQHGDAYTFADLDGMCRRAGFQPSQLHRLEPTPQAAVLARK